MKNRHATVLIFVTWIFVAFTLGFLTGRTTAPGDTVISRMPEPTVESTLPISEELRVIPTVSAIEPSESKDSGLININTATLAQLDTLPGIGPVLAQRIIDYRTANGPFTSVSQLTLVEGIGQKRLAALLDLITIE